MNLSDLVSSSRQSIKIVPSIEDSLREHGLNVYINDEVKFWFNQLQLTWRTWKKSPALEHHFNSLYNFDDPHRIALVCIIKCQEFKDSKPKTLPYFILESLNKWSQISKIDPSDSLKLPAFHIAAMQRNNQFLHLAVQTFNIKTIKNEIVPIVKNIIKNDNCKQGSQIVSALELFDEIPIEDLLFPLILQDKINVIDEYLTECPSQVQPLLYFLDSLLDKKCIIRDYVQNFLEHHTVYNIRYDKLHYKPLGKLVARLCTKYNVPVGNCKNLSKNRTSGGLRYLIYQKYLEHNVSASVWDDLVKDSLNRTEGCAGEFINILSEYDIPEALKWAKYLKIMDKDLPSALKNLTIQESTSTPVEEEQWDDNETPTQFYELPIEENSIIMIDTAEKFYDTLSTMTACNLVSIDCEWKPSFGATQSQVALIQIATPSTVYLIDTLLFNQKHYASFWSKFTKSFLENGEIVKLGFGLEQDLKEVKASIIGCSNIKVKGEGLLDLSFLWKNLTDHGLCIPNSSDIEGKGLSSLVQMCFGLPLRKSEQCSNWELRPLRQSQIYYAAIDAYVLLEIYSYLKKLSQEQNINFEEMCNEVMLDKKPKNIKKSRTSQKLEAAACNFTKSPKDLRLLVETELSYLMGYLRHCGIDTIVIPSNMVWHDAVEVALIEDRNILTSKLKLTCSAKFQQSSILNMGKGQVKEQLQKIFTILHVVLTQEDLFKRCIYCNGVDLRMLQFNELSDINSSCHIDNSRAHKNRNFYNNVNCDEALDGFLSEDEDEAYISNPVQTHVQNKPIIVTAKGATLDLENFCNIYSYFKAHQNETILLCEKCGKFCWREDETIKTIHNAVAQFVDT